MRAFICAIAILLVCAMQSSFAYFLSIGSIKPDFVLVFVVLVSVVYGRMPGLVVGFFCGLIIDLTIIGMFGFNTICLVLVGLLAGSMQENVYEDNFILPTIIVGISTLIVQIVWYFSIWFTGYRMTDFLMIILFVLAKPIYNMVLTLPLFFLFKRAKKFVK